MNMQLNSKRRKLIFIRHKNRIREGRAVCQTSFKASRELIDSIDPKVFEKEISYNYHLGCKALIKKWKLKFDFIGYTYIQGIDGADFIYDLRTIVITHIHPNASINVR